MWRFIRSRKLDKGCRAADSGVPAGRETPQGLAPRLHDRARLETLLPMLRCPISAESLCLAADGAKLISESGRVEWGIQEGRPLLFGGISKATRHPDSHISNDLCGRAVDLIERTEGAVLNLSAGGSRAWHPRVVEVEASIFRNTDLVADAHVLPFREECFDLVISMNAFEHYASPETVAGEIRRVLRPGGYVFIHTAFLQPLHEAPYHFYNCTKYGLARWFTDFHTLDLKVSDNFAPGFSVSWLLSEVELALRGLMSNQAADAFCDATVRSLLRYWRDPASRQGEVWEALSGLPQEAQERVAAGFEYFGQKRR